MKAKDRETLRAILEFEDTTSRERDWPMGWCWRQVRVWPGTLNRLCLEGQLETLFRSNSYTGYRLTEAGRALAQGGEPAAQATEDPEPTLPEDLFAGIIGHGEVKELLGAAIMAERPVHVLLAGPPALAKSLFLWDLERVYGERALWALGSASSRAGLLEVLLERRPRLLLVDELDKLDGADQTALLSVLEGGRVTRTKVGKMADVALELRVVAACNDLRRLAPELLSRFAIRKIMPYTSQEFQEVVVGVLVVRESLPEAQAKEIAQRLSGRSQDVRDAVRAARLSSRLGVERAVELLLP